jgi:carboxyl-terminal processing protease
LTDSDGAPEEELDDQLDAESQDEVKEDFEVSFARDFIVAAPAVRRDEMLKLGRTFVVEKRQVEEKRIADAISGLGVDWAAGPTPRHVQLSSVLKPGSDKKLVAGESAQLELTVENKGTEAVPRLRAWVESENGFLDRREFLFGLLKPGEKKSWAVTVKTSKDLASRRDGVTVKLQDDSGLLQESVAGELNFVELPRPQFAYSWSVTDSCEGCNGDGLAQRGEDLTLVLDVTNVGAGKALDTFASIRNASDANIFIEKGRFKLGELAVGETKSAKFQLEVKKGYKGDDFGLRVAIIDEPLEEFTADKLIVPVAQDTTMAMEPRKPVVVRLADRSELFAAADSKRPLLRLPKGGLFNEVARGSNVARVELGEGRFAFAKLTDVKDAKGQKAIAPKEVDWISTRTPAQISLNIDPSQGGTVVDTEKFTLSGVVTDRSLLDVFVLVNDQKVFFRGRTPDEGDRLKFSTEVSLKEGNNLLTVVARESQDFASRKTVVVRRRPPPPAVAQKASGEKTEAKP